MHPQAINRGAIVGQPVEANAALKNAMQLRHHAACRQDATPLLQTGVERVLGMKKGLRILLLEDNAMDADLIGRTLKRGGLNFAIKCVENREDFERQLRELPPDLILSDFADKAGLVTEKIWVLPRGKGNSSQQMGRWGRVELRKCVYWWRKI